MTKGSVTHLVIDASVARSVGTKNALDEQSIACRAVLTVAYRKHKILVMTLEIDKEWRKHASSVAIEWWAIMIAKRRIAYIQLNEWANLWVEIVACTGKKEPIDKEQLPGMQKDFHLIRAALQTDKMIISSDNKARNLYSLACTRVEQLNDILWMNPISDRVAEWIQSGALIATARRLRDAEE